MLKMTNKIQIFLFLTLALLGYLFFGFQHLAKFETADERYWMYEDPQNGRIHAYWKAIGEKKWEGTYINDKPGVSLAYISGIALFFKDKPADNLFTGNLLERIYNPQETERVHFLFRLPLLIFNGLFCLVLFWLIGKFTQNHWIALWSTIFILLSPILLGISQIVNPDSLLWSFSAGTIFAFLSYLKKREKKFIFLSALFLGFSLLSKYSAVILMPFLLAVLLIDVFFEQSHGENVTPSEMRRLLGAYGATIGGALLVFSFFFPVVFVNPVYLYDAFLELSGFQYVAMACGAIVLGLFLDSLIFKNKAFFWLAKKINRVLEIFPRVLSVTGFLFFTFILITWAFDTSYGAEFMKNISFDLEKSSTFTHKALLVRIVLEMMPLIFSLTPLALFSLLFLLGKASLGKVARVKIIFSLLFFLLAFYAAVLLQNLLVTIRYSIMLYPLIMLLSGLGIWELFSMKRLEKINKVWITAGILLISFWSLWEIKPFYFNYTSDLLPKTRIITDAWGYGGYEAAQYLNNLPNAENLLIWTDYNGYCPFFKGRCIMGKSNGKFKLREGEPVPDYFVKTRRGGIMYRGMWDTINSRYLYEKEETAWELVINDRAKNYVKVFKYEPKKDF
jgi:hypothetical protein